jgi:hypothetical protein
MVLKLEAQALQLIAAGANNDSVSGESGDDYSVEEVYTMPRPAPTRRSAPVRATEPPPEAMPHDPAAPLFDTVITDVSQGKPKELLGKSTMVESQVLKRLYPKGGSVHIQQSLAEATLDATSLDGAYSNNALEAETDGDIANLTAAIRGTGEPGAKPVDSIWKKPSRNPLTGVTDSDGLVTLVEKYSRMRDPALENMANEFRNIIGVQLWKDSDVDAYLISGMLPSIARWTVDGGLLLRAVP